MHKRLNTAGGGHTGAERAGRVGRAGAAVVAHAIAGEEARVGAQVVRRHRGRRRGRRAWRELRDGRHGEGA